MYNSRSHKIENIKNAASEHDLINKIKSYCEFTHDIHIKSSEKEIVFDLLGSFIPKYLIANTSELVFFNADKIFKHIMTCIWINACFSYWDKKLNYPIFHFKTDEHVHIYCYQVGDSMEEHRSHIKDSLKSFSASIIKIINHYYEILTPIFTLGKQLESRENSHIYELKEFIKELKIDAEVLKEFSNMFLDSSHQGNSIEETLLLMQAEAFDHLKLAEASPIKRSDTVDEKMHQIRLAAIKVVSDIVNRKVIPDCDELIHNLKEEIEKVTGGANLITMKMMLPISNGANTDFLQILRDVANSDTFKKNDELLLKLVKLLEDEKNYIENRSFLSIFSSYVVVKNIHLNKLLELTSKLVDHQFDLTRYKQQISDMGEDYCSKTPHLFSNIISLINYVLGNKRKTLLPKDSIQIGLYNRHRVLKDNQLNELARDELTGEEQGKEQPIFIEMNSTSNNHMQGTPRMSFRKRKGLAIQDQIALPNSEIMFGQAIDDGDCFFDSLAQFLNQLYHANEYTIKSLRQLCYAFYCANKKLVDEWNHKDRINVLQQEEYYLVQYTYDELVKDFNNRPPVWGRPAVEGVMLCRALDLPGICVIEILRDMDTEQPVTGYYLVDKTGYRQISDEEEIKKLFANTMTPKLVVEQESLHFVPILYNTLVNEKDRIAQEDTYQSANANFSRR